MWDWISVYHSSFLPRLINYFVFSVVWPSPALNYPKSSLRVLKSNPSVSPGSNAGFRVERPWDPYIVRSLQYRLRWLRKRREVLAFLRHFERIQSLCSTINLYISSSKKEELLRWGPFHLKAPRPPFKYGLEYSPTILKRLLFAKPISACILPFNAIVTEGDSEVVRLKSLNARALCTWN